MSLLVGAGSVEGDLAQAVFVVPPPGARMCLHPGPAVPRLLLGGSDFHVPRPPPLASVWSIDTGWGLSVTGDSSGRFWSEILEASPEVVSQTGSEPALWSQGGVPLWPWPPPRAPGSYLPPNPQGLYQWVYHTHEDAQEARASQEAPGEDLDGDGAQEEDQPDSGNRTGGGGGPRSPSVSALPLGASSPSRYHQLRVSFRCCCTKAHRPAGPEQHAFLLVASGGPKAKLGPTGPWSGVGRAASSLGSGESPCTRLFQPLEAACVPWSSGPLPCLRSQPCWPESSSRCRPSRPAPSAPSAPLRTLVIALGSLDNPGSS